MHRLQYYDYINSLIGNESLDSEESRVSEEYIQEEMKKEVSAQKISARDAERLRSMIDERFSWMYPHQYAVSILPN